MRARRGLRGMTLVEVMIVLVILVGVMVAFVPMGQGDKADIKISEVKLRKVGGQLERYRGQQESGVYPASLDVLVTENYLKEADLHDAWGRAIVYRLSLERVVLIAVGKDGELGTEDDVEWTGQAARL